AMEEERTPEETAKMEAEQLRIEVKLTREKISKVAPDILAHVESNMADDPLVKGVPEDKNPFKEKGGCVIS
uniref:Guanine nucleotide-binding protein subunit gamma n=2 Tax=Petromyzon marinus TaxID=7757 RepID=S4RVY4_PETMA